MTPEEVAKLDHLIALVTDIRIELAQHIAKDEAAWAQVRKNEDEIKDLVQKTDKTRLKVVVLATTIGAGIASGAQAALRFL